MSDSYPPHLLRLPGSRPGGPARGREGTDVPAAPSVPVAVRASPGGQQDPPPVLLATPGEPGTYAPPVTPVERPVTMQELAERVRLQTPEPWPAGTWLPLGRRGRRAHWDGTGWKCNNSPGYGAELVAVRLESVQMTGAEQ